MFVTVALTLVLAAKPPPDPRQDLLDAMVAEINRNQAELKLRENRSPYFIGYQLKDYDAREVVARYGAIFQDMTTRDRKIGVDVRVGDYTFDSSIGDELDLSFSLKGSSYLTKKSAPIDDSPQALRTALWLVTDEKYKQALFNYLKKKGDEVYSVDDPSRPPSFSKESPEVQLTVRVPFAFARDRWLGFARACHSRSRGSVGLPSLARSRRAWRRRRRSSIPRCA